jgi:LysM repeat protein
VSDPIDIDARGRIDALLAVALALVACAAPPTPPALPPDPPPPVAVRAEPAADAVAAVHVVRRGETLSQIAEGYAVDVDRLAHANELRDADRIAVGQHLRIPAASAGTARAEALVEHAADLYRNARFELALKRAEQAQMILAARGSSPPEEPQRALGARAAFITGCALAAFGENERAIAAFSEARALHPQFEPPEGWLSPRLEALYLAERNP